MIQFHGGAWLGGTLDEFRNTCAYFASRGLVCATAEYLARPATIQYRARELRKRGQKETLII